MKPGNGVVVLVLGILAWCGLSLIAGIPAWIIGNQSLREMDAGYMSPSDRSLVEAGRLLGLIATVVSLCGFVLVFVIWLVVMLVAGAGIAGSGLFR